MLPLEVATRLKQLIGDQAIDPDERENFVQRALAGTVYADTVHRAIDYDGNAEQFSEKLLALFLTPDYLQEERPALVCLLEMMVQESTGSDHQEQVATALAEVRPLLQYHRYSKVVWAGKSFTLLPLGHFGSVSGLRLFQSAATPAIEQQLQTVGGGVITAITPYLIPYMSISFRATALWTALIASSANSPAQKPRGKAAVSEREVVLYTAQPLPFALGKPSASHATVAPDTLALETLVFQPDSQQPDGMALARPALQAKAQSEAQKRGRVHGVELSEIVVAPVTTILQLALIYVATVTGSANREIVVLDGLTLKTQRLVI